MKLHLQISFNNETISFLRELQPNRAKYQIKLVYHSQKGFIVRHAQTIGLTEIEQFLRTHQQWILSKYQQKQSNQENFLLNLIRLHFLGEEYCLNISLVEEIPINIVFDNHQFKIFLPQKILNQLEEPSHLEHEFAKNLLREAINSWYKDQAKNIFPKLFLECLKQCEWIKKTPNLSIKIQKTRWGSCSSLGNINLNASLVRFEESVIKSVILHELCHLKYLNHSEQFYQLLTTVSPNWRKHDKFLKNFSSNILF